MEPSGFQPKFHLGRFKRESLKVGKAPKMLLVLKVSIGIGGEDHLLLGGPSLVSNLFHVKREEEFVDAK